MYRLYAQESLLAGLGEELHVVLGIKLGLVKGCVFDVEEEIVWQRRKKKPKL